MSTPIRRADLVKGGDVVKQGDIFTLGFQLFGDDNKIIVPTTETITAKIANKTGVVYETVGRVVENRVEFDITQDLGSGIMRLEFKVSKGTTVVQKYPSEGFIQLRVTPSLDDAGVGGIIAISATQMRAEITAINTQAEQAVLDATGAKELAEYTQTQVDTVLGASTIDPAVAQMKVGTGGIVYASPDARLRAENTSITTQLAEKATQTDFNANDYGADPSASWAVNRDAFQAANNATTANGGGRVVAKAGLYLVKGIIQDENVEFHLPGVTLKNPDGAAPSVIEARKFYSTGSIATGSNQLSVVDVSKVKVGAVVIVHRAGGILDTQFTTLTDAIDATTNAIQIGTNNGYFPKAGFLQIDNEIIEYTSLNGTSLVGATRGALGTSPATHASGTYIGVSRHHYAEVTAIQGNVLTLNKNAVAGVSGVKVDIGILNPKLSNVKVDANKISTGHSSSVYGVVWGTVRWGVISNLEVINGDMGGLILGAGATDNVVNTIRLKDCGVWDSASPKGSGLWLFQGCNRNRITGLTVTGKGWTGFYLDDRTSVAEGYDAPNEDNYIDGFTIDIIRPEVGAPPAFVIVGSNRNKVLNGYAQGTVMGVEITGGGQYLRGDGLTPTARDNEVAGVHFDVYQPWILHSTGNRLHECTYTAKANSVPIVTAGNLVYAVTTIKGNPIDILSDIKFKNGTANSPGMTWIDDANTGFYKDSTGIIRVALAGQLKYSFYGTEFRLADGVTLATGTTLGTKIGLVPSQKIGFYGKTPMVQPLAIGDLPVDATLQQVRDTQQMVLVTLRNLGLISST